MEELIDWKQKAFKTWREFWVRERERKRESEREEKERDRRKIRLIQEGMGKRGFYREKDWVEKKRGPERERENIAAIGELIKLMI